MAAHTYWRLNFAGADGGATLTIAEVEMRTSVAGATVTSGGTASASSGANPGNAFDVNNATNMTLTGTVGWLKYAFAAPVDIVEHAITAPSATMTNAPNRWSLQYSDDDITWITEALVGGQTGWTSNEQRVFTNSGYGTAIGKATLRPTLIAANRKNIETGNVRATLRSQPALQPSPMLSGTVKQSGIPCARTVRAYNRNTGEILGETVSDAVTGAFSINARGYTDFCYCVCLDDLTLVPDYNAAIYDLLYAV